MTCSRRTTKKRTSKVYLFSCRTSTRPYGPVCLSVSDSDFSGGEEEEFDELDHRDEGQFWSTKDEPDERENSPAYELYDSDSERPTPVLVISLFAIGKLCR